MNKILTFFLTVAAPVLAMAGPAGPDRIVPRPVSYTVQEGSWRGDEVKVSVGDKSFAKELKALGITGFAADEAYSLKVDAKGAHIRALTEEGAFRARQSLDYMKEISGGEVSYCSIFDYPRFQYRGQHFDLSRHFRDKDFILKQIPALARTKINRLHLHLTDDAGWRLEVDGWPRMTSLAAWRPGRNYVEWRDVYEKSYVEEGTPRAHGGWLSKEDVREIVDLAAQYHIEVIPEIEIPGHSAEVLAAYPELACTDEDGNPVLSSDVCPGNELTFKFFQDVLDEVMELFPSELIHIGGDEASKKSWASCPRCRERMEAEGLEDVDQLQSYTIRRISEYVASKGRRIIGWDEIMEGGLAPGATVMSWRGTAQGMEAMAAGHDVVMTPTSYCYLDYYQDAPLHCPEAFGSYIPLSKIYGYDPAAGISEGLGHLLGLQANLWCEYVPTEEHFEYMLYPRTFAVAEIGWSPQEVRDYPDFKDRVLGLLSLMQEEGYHPFDLASEYGERPEKFIELQHLGRGKKVIYNSAYSASYAAGGDAALTDGVQGGWSYKDDAWQGFNRDMDVIVDLGEIMDVHFVGAHYLSSIPAWIGFPERTEVWLSEDGIDYEKAGSTDCELSEGGRGTIYSLFGIPVSGKARYVRLKGLRSTDKYHGWIFIDEVIVN